MKKTRRFSICIILLCFALLQACIPMRKVVYMKNNPIMDKEITTTPPVHQLEIGDVLFVRIISLNDKSYEFFNVETNTNSPANNTSMANLYLNGSTINSLGMIEIPVIGKVYLLGQNLEEAKKNLELSIETKSKLDASFNNLGFCPISRILPSEDILSVSASSRGSSFLVRQ